MNMEQATVEGGVAKLLQNLVTGIYSILFESISRNISYFPLSLNIINLISFLTQNLLIIPRVMQNSSFLKNLKVRLSCRLRLRAEHCASLPSSSVKPMPRR